MDTLHVAKREMNKFKTAIEYFHYPTMYIDLEGDVLTFNQELSQILGFDGSSEIGQLKFIDLVATEDRQNAISHYEKILLGAGSAVRDTYPLLKQNGEKIEVEISGTLLEDARGTQYGVLFSFHSIQSYARRRELIREYLYYIKHELKSPLNAVLGFSEILLDDEDVNNDKKEFIRLIYESGSDMMNLIESISEVPVGPSDEKGGHLKITYEWFSLDTIFSFIEYIGQMLIYRTGKDINLRAVHPNDVDLYLYGDRQRVKQILINLLSNAVKFTETGEVEFGVEENEKEEYEFFVRDTGEGIPEEEQTLVFYPYFQSDKVGLSITKHFVEDMGGELFLCSALNEGTAFYFTLPPFSIG